jgi:hypothetical protein
LNLAPSSYYAGFSIGSGGQDFARYDHDVVIGKPFFKILPISIDGDPAANWNPGWGNIVIKDVKLTVIGENIT